MKFKTEILTAKSYMLLAKIAHKIISLLNWRYDIRPLTTGDIAPACELLSQSFTSREPMSRYFQIEKTEITPHFNEMLQHVTPHKLSLIIIDKKTNQIAGALVNEDASDRFAPAYVTHRLKRLFGFFKATEQLYSLPDNIESGTVYHVLVFAMKPHKNRLLSLHVFLTNFIQMISMGYKHGFAEISNPKILNIFKKFRGVVGGKFFNSSFHHHGSVSLAETLDTKETDPEAKDIQLRIWSWALHKNMAPLQLKTQHKYPLAIG